MSGVPHGTSDATAPRSPFADLLSGRPLPSSNGDLNINDAVDFAGVLEPGFKHTIGEGVGTAFRGWLREDFPCDARGRYDGSSPGAVDAGRAEHAATEEEQAFVQRSATLFHHQPCVLLSHARAHA